jgi:hypothetical protein
VECRLDRSAGGFRRPFGAGVGTVGIQWPAAATRRRNAEAARAVHTQRRGRSLRLFNPANRNTPAPPLDPRVRDDIGYRAMIDQRRQNGRRRAPGGEASGASGAVSRQIALTGKSKSNNLLDLTKLCS